MIDKVEKLKKAYYNSVSKMTKEDWIEWHLNRDDNLKEKKMELILSRNIYLYKLKFKKEFIKEVSND